MVSTRLTGHAGGMIRPGTDLDHCLVAPGDSIHRIQEAPMTICLIPRDLVRTLPAGHRVGAMDQPA
jgi:hypothetical protein